LPERIDPFRRLCLGQPFVERLTGLFGQRSQVRGLRSGHRLVAGLPLFGITPELIGHASAGCTTDADPAIGLARAILSAG
jgi:hypothetical protein